LAYSSHWLFWDSRDATGLIAQHHMRFIHFIVKRLKLIFARASTGSIYATAAKYDYSNLE
jgi:hypothetical protein